MTVAEYLGKTFHSPHFVVLASGLVADGFHYDERLADRPRDNPPEAFDIYEQRWVVVSFGDEIVEVIDRPWSWRGLVEPPARRTA